MIPRFTKARRLYRPSPSSPDSISVSSDRRPRRFGPSRTPRLGNRLQGLVGPQRGLRQSGGALKSLMDLRLGHRYRYGNRFHIETFGGADEPDNHALPNLPHF